MRGRRLIRTVAIASLLLLGSCATVRVAEPGANGAQAAALKVPLLKLAPGDLPVPLDEEQQLTFTFNGESRSADALVSSDATQTQIAIVIGGQTAMKLRWDGRDLTQERKPWVPAQLDAAQILNDLQMAFWPVPSIQKYLPFGWVVSDEGATRTLRHQDADVEVIDRDGQGNVLLRNLVHGYSLKIQRVRSANP